MLIINVNVGVDRRDSKTIKAVEADLLQTGVYFDNDGGDVTTYNINAGFTDRHSADKFIIKWAGAVYIDTETMEA